MLQFELRAVGRDNFGTGPRQNLDDVRHSLADVSKVPGLRGYVPTHTMGAGGASVRPWYVKLCSSVSSY